MKALQIAATGMAAQQMKVDVVSNNLANMSTTGYNPRRADFADLTYQQMARPGSVFQMRSRAGSGWRSRRACACGG